MSSLTPSESTTCAFPCDPLEMSHPSTTHEKDSSVSNSSEAPLSPSQLIDESNPLSPHSLLPSKGTHQDGEAILVRQTEKPFIHNVCDPPPPFSTAPVNAPIPLSRPQPKDLEQVELPPPSTAPYRHRSTAGRSAAFKRAIPIVIALFVALSLLLALVLLLLAQFRKIDAIIGTADDVNHLYHVSKPPSELGRPRRSLRSKPSTSKPQLSYLLSAVYRDFNVLFQCYRILASTKAAWSPAFLMAVIPPPVQNETTFSIRAPSVRLQVPTSVHDQSDNIISDSHLSHHSQLVSSDGRSAFAPTSFLPLINTTTKMAMIDQSRPPQNPFALSNNQQHPPLSLQALPSARSVPTPTPFIIVKGLGGLLKHPPQPHHGAQNGLSQGATGVAVLLNKDNVPQKNGNSGSTGSSQMRQVLSGSVPQTPFSGPVIEAAPVAIVPLAAPIPGLPLLPPPVPPHGPSQPGANHQMTMPNSLHQNAVSNPSDVSQNPISHSSKVAGKDPVSQSQNGLESSGFLYPGSVMVVPGNEPKLVTRTGENSIGKSSGVTTATESPTTTRGVPSYAPQQNTTTVPRLPSSRDRNIDSIEVWHLPRGRSLCRIFNAGITESGKIVLPVWTMKHKDFLTTKCGFVNGIFGILGRNGKVDIDRKILERELSTGYELDIGHRDLDLFSPEIPRLHMPHFVSDIIRPLVATEVLMGTGRNALPAFSLLETSQTSTLVQSDRRNDDLNPALFIDPVTESGTAGQWVRRLSAFFKHPQLKFTMVPKISKAKLANGSKMKITLFHSVFLTSVKPYEPYGLFGTSGKNIVFATNGISREPPWKMVSMREQPCRITITALTRKGPRALLNLNKLEEMIKSRATAANMRADFSIVDFTEMTFDEQVRTMQQTHILIATHGAGNANIIFMRPGAAFVEVFPFSYKAGPFDGFAKIFGLEYSTAMSAPQTNVFKTCMNEHEKNDVIKRMVFEQWDNAVEEHKTNPWVHRLEFEKEFGEPGKSQGMPTRGCVRLQQLEFNIDAVSNVAISAGRSQCYLARVSK